MSHLPQNPSVTPQVGERSCATLAQNRLFQPVARAPTYVGSWYRPRLLVVQVDVGLSSLWERSSGEIEPAGFGTIRVTVHVDTDASPEAIRALIAHAVLWPPSPTLCMIR